MKRAAVALLFALGLSAPALADTAGGLTWTPPADWASQAERPMRAATYRIGPVKGDAEPAELAVFYFGPNDGGGVDANIQRWIGQFTRADGKPVQGETKKAKIAGLSASTLDVRGTYMGGSMMGAPAAPKPGYRLIGAIVEGAQGNVFFKLTGPEKTVTAAEQSLRKMLDGIKKK